MKILAIRLKNLASFEGVFEVDFETEPLRSAGIFAISGSTGAGKSTILDALCLALYDKAPRFSASNENIYLTDVGDSLIKQSDVKNILRRGTGEGFAEVDFLGAMGHRFRSRWSVRRSRSKADGSLQTQSIRVTDLDAGKELQGGKAELLNELVSLIGLTYEQFTRTVLLAQNDFATFLKSRESAKAELLEKLTGTDIYSRISKEIYGRAKQTEQELNQLKGNLAMIELLPEEELCLLREDKEKLSGVRDKETKILAELNEQLNIVRSLKTQQEHLLKKQQEENLETEKRNKLMENVVVQTETLTRFRLQCDALQPDLKKASELDIKILSSRNLYRQAEQVWKGACQQTGVQEKKWREEERALQASRQAVEQLIRYKDVSFLAAEKVLGEEEKSCAVLLQQNDERADRLNAFNITSLNDEQNRLVKEQTRLQSMRQQMLDWKKAQDEVERLNNLLATLLAKQELTGEEVATLANQLVVKEGQIKTLRQLYENARITMSKDVRSLRDNLREKEPCPVCGSIGHPYREKVEVADTLYHSIEKEYKMALDEFQKLNSRVIALNSDLRNLAGQREQIVSQLQVVQKEVAAKCPQRDEERHPEYFERELERIRNHRESLSLRLSEYQKLYEEWQQHNTAIKKMQKHLEDLRAEINRFRLLTQKTDAAGEQLTLFRSVEKIEQERYWAVKTELDALCKERGALLKGKSVAEAESAVQRREKELNALLEGSRSELESVQMRLSGLQGEVKQLSQSIGQLTAQQEKIPNPEHLPVKIVEQQNNNRETERRLSLLEARMLQQVQNKAKLESMAGELERKQTLAEQWGKLNKLIGSADGTKFKVIAQGYTLNLLLLHANKHLAYLSKRYKLQQVPGTLALQVVDCDMCDEVRTVYSLSGGESFLISLALALGLSSLSSNNLKVESLFIDEGFGSLDADSLRTAMEALEQLQMQGRKIGVISHVQEMRERISVQIEVRKKVNGKSEISV